MLVGTGDGTVCIVGGMKDKFKKTVYGGVYYIDISDNNYNYINWNIDELNSNWYEYLHYWLADMNK